MSCSEFPGNRRVGLKVPTDQYEREVYRLTYADQAGSRADSDQGQLTLDDTNIHNKCIIWGGGVQYEMTCELIPGWKYNDGTESASVFDSIDKVSELSTQALKNGELIKIHTAEQTYVGADAITYGPFDSLYNDDPKDAHKLRFWVLNEDGAFSPEANPLSYKTYVRSATSRYNTAKYAPFDWRSSDVTSTGATGGLKPMTFANVPVREYWSMRRRRFLPLYVKADQMKPIIIEISFDSGDNWTSNIEGTFSCDVVAGRCGIMFTGDPRKIEPTVEAGAASTAQPYDPIKNTAGTNFIVAYVNGTLRVRVTAMIEADHCHKVIQQSGDSFIPNTERVLHLNRREQYPCKIRTINTEGPTGGDANLQKVANSRLYPGIVSKRNIMATAEIVNMADNVLDDSDIRRTNGQFNMLYIDYSDPITPSNRFRLGDEVTALISGRASSGLSLQSCNPRLDRVPPGPMIVKRAIHYTRSGGQATTYNLEMHTDDIGDQVQQVTNPVATATNGGNGY